MSRYDREIFPADPLLRVCCVRLLFSGGTACRMGFCGMQHKTADSFMPSPCLINLTKSSEGLSVDLNLVQSTFFNCQSLLIKES